MNDTAQPATRLWRAALAQVDALLQQEESERAAVLATLASTQPELHSLVSGLLCAQRDAESSGFLEPQRTAVPEALRDGATLGPYRIVSQLGAGGMGEVWLARRSDGLFEGEVAIKTLHPWFARGALRERFLREAQLLGRISHPNIARLLDAGVAADGSVYLVLEYVRGKPLDEYCDERRLDIAARLRLFLAVCTAVAHAHSHLIVHRDLKPSNILVTDTGEVKLLDFGVATLLEADAAANSQLTRLTGRAFTPEFAAPEQLRGEPITTATDVYSLGVLLHLLLTGQRPHAQHAEAALEHAVLCEEALLPSRVARACPDTTVAEHRGTSLARWRRELAGDLDNIVAHALEKRPADRYDGVQAFAADVERHLRHLPVQARAASLRYRAAKFLRRNRLPVAVGTAALAAVLVGASVALWQAKLARIEARKATSIRDFLVGVFERNSVAHPDGAEARKVTAEELLAQSAREIRTGLGDSPEVRRELLGVMSRLYATLDLQAPAIELLQDKLADERATFGERSLPVARTLSDLSYSQAQSGEYAASEQSARQSLAIFDALGDETSIEHARAYGNLGQAGYRLGRGAEAVRANFAAALALVEAHHPRSKYRIDMLLGMARAENYAQDNEAAVRYCEQAKALLDSNAVEANGIVRGSAYQTLGFMLTWVYRYDESEQLMRAAIAEYEKAGGPDHPFAAEGRHELGKTFMWRGRREDASQLIGQALASLERTKGPDDPDLTAHVRTDYASTLYLRGEYAAAEPHMEHAWRVVSPQGGSLLPHVHLNLGRLRTQQGRFAEAHQHLDDIEAQTMSIFGKGSWMHATALARAGELALAEGRTADARQVFNRLWSEFEEPEDGLANNRAAARLGLLRLALAAGDVTRARADAIELLAAIERSRGRPDMPDEEAAAHMLSGVALLRAGDVAAARTHLEQAVAMRERMDAPQSLWLAEARLYLAQSRHAAGHRDEARQLLALAQDALRTQGRVGPQYVRLLADTRATLSR
ncbi:MAG TPA: protein kinase [Steroidobacteraceae bacterium]|nr:protein kinase [Steroidobacteraceae bacterium]